MILKPLLRNDFSIAREARVDIENRGFTEREMEQLTASSLQADGAKGWSTLWTRNRQIPPEQQTLRSEVGFQTAPLLTDLLAVAEAQDTKLDGVIKAKAPKYNFYIMRCGVYVVPEDGEQFEALKFEVRYKNDRVSTYTMLPASQAKQIFALGAKAEVGVDGKLAFGIPDISLKNASADASAKAKLDAKFVVSFEYELKSQVVDSFGVGNSFCKWFMHQGDALRNDVVFYPIVIAPKEVAGFDCEFRAFFKVKHSQWKSDELYEVPPKTIAVSS